MKNKLHHTFKMLVITVIMVGFIGCGGGSDSNPQNAGGEKKEEAIPVEVEPVKRGDISAYFTGTASLEAEGEAMVVAKVAGVVENIYTEEGHQVKEGQVLAQLEDDKMVLDLEEATALLNKLERDFKRYQELYEKKIVSTEAYEQIKSDYEMQKTKVGQAKLMKEYTAIKAPISGTVAQRMIKKGNMVPVNTTCFHITDFDPLLALLHVPEKEMSKLKINQETILTVDALQAQEFTGKILRISPVVDPQTGTFKVTVAVKDPGQILKPGMFARLKIQYDVHTDTLMVPKDAILMEGEEAIVFVIREEMPKIEDKENKDKTKTPQPTANPGESQKPGKNEKEKPIKVARRVLVKTGYINTFHTEIIEGLKEGDIVVHTGIGALKDGSEVDIIPSGKDAGNPPSPTGK